MLEYYQVIDKRGKTGVEEELCQVNVKASRSSLQLNFTCLTTLRCCEMAVELLTHNSFN